MNYNQKNFHKKTFCVFTEVPIEIITPLQLAYKSKSGSAYYFTTDGVYRLATHWGRVANCRWKLRSNELKVNQVSRLGYAAWTDFYPLDELQKMFFVQHHSVTNRFSILHRDGNVPIRDAKLRTLNEAIQIVKQCEKLVVSNDWAKYLDVENLEELKKHWIEKLLNSDTSLANLKREMINS